MTGIEIIEWAARKCREEGVPPSDSAIVRMIRYHLIDVSDVGRKVTGNKLSPLRSVRRKGFSIK